MANEMFDERKNRKDGEKIYNHPTADDFWNRIVVLKFIEPVPLYQQILPLILTWCTNGIYTACTVRTPDSGVW